jgi:uroporphyrinogen-III decarboxylase
MDHREQMMAVVRGEIPDRLLFVPRLDIWYNRNKVRGTLPSGFERLSLAEIAAALGVGFHSVVPDFIRSAPVEDLYHRGLGFYNNPEFPFVADFREVDFDVSMSDDDLTVVYHGAKGDIRTRCSFGRKLLESGSSIPDILEYAVKDRADYACLGEILSRVKLRPTPGRYRTYRDRVGRAGIAVAYISLACGPMHHVMRDLRRYEEFCLDLYDDPELLAPCVEPLSELHRQLIESVLQCDAEVVLYGANYDDTITYLPFFREHILPWLNRAAERLHSAGKFLLTHTDGENEGLLSAFSGCSLDIADSVCPAPMTRLSLKDYRDVFRDRTTIWGGIPSNVMLKSCCSDSEFRAFVKDAIETVRPYDRFILGIADTTPPDAETDRIRYLAEQSAKAAAS